LVHQAHGSLPRAIDTVSGAPARHTGLRDRGEIAPVLRADFVRVALHGTLPVTRASFVLGRRFV
ncbi:alpha-D-ribose 1-methylphosphonate 5-triphosphate diphosphatase, partial [Burkholderia pseudomallei]